MKSVVRNMIIVICFLIGVNIGMTKPIIIPEVCNPASLEKTLEVRSEVKLELERVNFEIDVEQCVSQEIEKPIAKKKKPVKKNLKILETVELDEILVEADKLYDMQPPVAVLKITEIQIPEKFGC